MTALPDGWRRMALGDVAETALGKMLDRAKDRGLPRVRYLRNVNVQWGRIDTDDVLEMELADDERERFGVEAGDLLVCEGGEIGRAAIWTGSAEYMAYQKALHRVRPHEVLDSRFMLHQFAFLAQTNSFDGLATGSTIRHLPQQQLRRVPVVVPPLAEQRRIVDILEGHLSHLDAANDYLDAAAQRAASLRWAAVATRILTPAPKVTRHALEGVLTEYVGGVWGGPPGSDEVDVDVLRVTELKPWGRIDPSTAAHRAVSDRQLNRRRLRTGDLLLEKSGGGIGTPIGRVGLVPNLKATSVCSNFMQLMRPDTSKVVPRYLHLYLNALQATGRTEHLQKASTNLRNIKASEYSRLELDLPDLLTQELVVREIDTLWEQSARSEEVAIASRRREGTLRRRIIAAAFSGQLTGHVSDVDRVEELSFL